jgi:ParB family chromosome partitioning protein
MALDLSALDEAWDRGRGQGADTAARAPLSMFEEDPGNPRFEDNPDDFARLVADISNRGILQPIVVLRLDSGRLRVRFGARRLRAARHLGLADAPYIVTRDARQFDDYSQVAENAHRAALEPLELATFVAKKVAQGETQTSVAAKLGMHRSALTQLLCLTGDAPTFLLELYHARKCRSPLYLYRLRRLWDLNPGPVEEACRAASEIDVSFILGLETPMLPESRGANNRSAISTRSEQDSPAIVSSNDAEDGRKAQGASLASRSNKGRRRKGALANSVLVRPQLFGVFGGKEVLVELARRPSREGMVWLRYCVGGADSEVRIQDVVLSRLVDGAA